MASRPKLSGIQKQVLALYRGFLRTARLKSPEERHRIESVVSAEFRENARNVDRRNFVYIEYLLRRGKTQLEQLKNPDITGLYTLEINKEALERLGYYSGEEDIEFSSFSAGTGRAVKTWQATVGTSEDGVMTSELLERLFAGQIREDVKTQVSLATTNLLSHILSVPSS